MLAGTGPLKAAGIGAIGTLVAPPLRQEARAPVGSDTDAKPGKGRKKKILNISAADLWSSQKILQDKKGSPSQTYKKNICCLREAGEDLSQEDSSCDVVIAESQTAMEEFNAAKQDQERVRGMLHDSRESLDIAFTDMQES